MISRSRRRTAPHEPRSRGGFSPALLGGAALALLAAALIPRLAKAPLRPAPPARPAPAEAPLPTSAPPRLSPLPTSARPRLSPLSTSAPTPDEADETEAETIAPVHNPRRVFTQLGESMLPLVQPCYEAALARCPDLAGHIVLLIEIESDPADGGFVEEIDFTDETSIDDPEMRACVRDSLLTLTFEALTTEAGVLTVKYPIEFMP